MFSETAALPLAGVSALQALEQEIELRPRQKILIHEGAGGIGSFAIQFAKHLGCYVTTTVRASQKEFVRNLGSDRIIDFEVEQFENVLDDCDAVLDIVGGDVYRRSFQILKKNEIVVSMLQNPLNQDLMSKSCTRSATLTTQVNRASLSGLSELVDQGALRTQIDREFPFDKTHEAYAYFEQDHPKGKVVIRVK